MYKYYVNKKNPVGVWLLDGPLGLTDYSGNANHGTMKSGTVASSAPLVSGAERSSLFKSGVVGKFPFTYFKQSMESKPFALEAWVLPIKKDSSTSRIQILSHDGVFDGLTISGTTLRFGTSYVNTGNAFCEFDLGISRLAHVVGVHTDGVNELWVNGELVSNVTITQEQRVDSYIATDDFLYCGHTAGTGTVAVNALAGYPSITGLAINQNYLAGVQFIGQDSIVPENAGIGFDLNINLLNIIYEGEWLNRAQFESGLKSSVEYSDEAITPAFTDGISEEGSWVVSVPLDGQGDTSIYGAMIEWSGDGITVEATADDENWYPAENGRLTAAITEGMDPTDKDLTVRVAFAGGIADDTSSLENIRVVVMRNNEIENITARSVSVSHPAVPRKDHESNLYRDDNGIALSGGTLTIGPDTTEDPHVARTIEFWVKPLSGTPAVSASGTTYRNGVVDSTIPVGEWSLIHIVSASDITTNISLTGDCIVGQASIYPDPLSATAIGDIWRSYIGRRVVRVEEPDPLTLTESAPVVKTYAHDWAIDSGG